MVFRITDSRAAAALHADRCDMLLHGAAPPPRVRHTPVTDLPPRLLADIGLYRDHPDLARRGGR